MESMRSESRPKQEESTPRGWSSADRHGSRSDSKEPPFLHTTGAARPAGTTGPDLKSKGNTQRQFVSQEKWEKRFTEPMPTSDLETCNVPRVDGPTVLIPICESLALYEDNKDLMQQAVVLSELGVVMKTSGQSDRAADFYQRAIKIARRAGDLQTEATALLNYGSLLVREGDFESALQNAERSLELNRKGHRPLEEVKSLNECGRVYASMGKIDKALSFHAEARKNPTFKSRSAASSRDVGTHRRRLSRRESSSACHIVLSPGAGSFQEAKKSKHGGCDPQ